MKKHRRRAMVIENPLKIVAITSRFLSESRAILTCAASAARNLRHFFRATVSEKATIR